MTTEHNYKELVKTHKGIRAAAKAIGLAYSTFWGRLKQQHLSSFSSREITPPTIIDFPSEEEGNKYFILSSAQDSSRINFPFWENLKVFSDYLDAEIYIGGYTYNKSLFEDHSKASGHFHPDLIPNMRWNQIHLGDVVFCAEMNISPSAENPLSGFETYTGNLNAIFPHPKVQLTSVPNSKFDRTKIITTTGSITEPNYIPKKAGMKAQQHHIIGAVIVELAPDGASFFRHIIADKDGSFQDLDIVVKKGKISTGNSVEALVYGDIHFEKLNPVVAMSTWGYDTEKEVCNNSVNLLDWLKPKYQFFHDLFDHSARNHHTIGDAHYRFYVHKHGHDDVKKDLRKTANFLDETSRFFSKSVNVASNHNEAVTKWLKTADYRNDPTNAVYFLELQLEYYRNLENGVSSPAIFEYALRNLADLDGKNIHFNKVDESFTICNDTIECGNHGHLGANGSRGSPKQFSKQGKKCITGHTHTASIINGCYTVGVSGRLDLGYNEGNSSWSHTHCIVYPSGLRTLITMNKGRWFV